MSSKKKLLEKVLKPNSDGNWKLNDLIKLVKNLGFEKNTEKSGKKSKGSHKVFSKPGVVEIVNLQDDGHGNAKRYQVGQVRDIINKYNLVKPEEDAKTDDKTKEVKHETTRKDNRKRLRGPS